MSKVTTEFLLDEMADRCREAYVFERLSYESQTTGLTTYKSSPKWDGGEDSRGRVHKPVWPKMATFMLKHSLDPYRCIRYLFAARKNHLHPVLPNQIALPKHLPEFQGEMDVLKREIWNAFKFQKALFETKMGVSPLVGTVSTKQLWTLLLLNETLELSPLFRYCLAEDEGLKDVAKRYFHRALFQYILMPEEYDSCWEKWIPEDFKEQACAVRQSAPGRSNAARDE